MRDATSKALARYHAAYQNETYQAVQAALTPFTPDTEPVEIMNRLTDTALQLVGHPHYAETIQRLTQPLMGCIRGADSHLSDQFIEAVEAHLRRFVYTQSSPDHRPKRFQQVRLIDELLLTLRLVQLQDRLVATVPLGADLPGWERVTAYHLLRSAEKLQRAAQLLLDGDHTADYVGEQIERGLLFLAMALHEYSSLAPDPPASVTRAYQALQERK